MKDIYKISNLMSILRIVLVIPVIYLLIIDEKIIAVALSVVAGFTDFLDGFLARKLNQVTELGKILDPVADKIFISVVAILITIQGIIPLWFLLAIVTRDILILAGGVYAKSKTKEVLVSNFEGKATFVLIGVVILGILLDYVPAYKYGMHLALAAMIYSLALYTIRFFKVIKAK